MLIARLVFVAAVLAIPAIASAIELAGVELGTPLSMQFRAEHTRDPSGFCTEDTCMWDAQLGEITGKVYAKADAAGKIALVMVKAPSRMAESLFQAALDKWGKPTAVRTVEVQNAFGAKYPSKQATWTKKGAIAAFQQLCEDKDHSCVTLSLPSGSVSIPKAKL
jgi:hypothetical protein